jgi:hypothetical protein
MRRAILGSTSKLERSTRRHAVLPREHSRELGFLDITECDEIVADAGTVFSLLLERHVELITRDQPFTDE